MTKVTLDRSGISNSRREIETASVPTHMMVHLELQKLMFAFIA
jgi:hypothetical protein